MKVVTENEGSDGWRMMENEGVAVLYREVMEDLLGEQPP